MKKLEKQSLELYYQASGSYADIYKCLVDSDYFAYKELTQIDYFKKIIGKLYNIQSIFLTKSLLPIYMVYDKNIKQNIGYLTKWSDYYTMDDLYLYEKLNSLDTKLSILNSIKYCILELHSNGIIHGDIHMKNILVDINNFDAKLIDFDNCNYGKFRLDIEHANIIASKYIKKYGVNEGLDIYLLNHLTFELLRNVEWNEMDKHINEYYADFKFDSSIKRIVDSLVLNVDKPVNEFLIDNVYIKELCKGRNNYSFTNNI